MDNKNVSDSPMLNYNEAKIVFQYDDIKDKVEVQNEIVLTEKETKIFNFMQATVDEIGKGTVLRVAGGWVRDKLLGKESDDIDIAIDNMFGEELAEVVRKRLYEEEVKNGTADEKKGPNKGYGVIKANNEKSKHLETAVIKVYGEFIDLVNLRSEEYGEDSRVPTIEIGTPEQDAYRRDLTFNSLFYNINTREIEDYTKKGIDDLKNEIVRTPLPPKKTFIDDPLRVLRTIRFAQRFGFKITQDFIEASRDPEVLEGFNTKLTAERIAKELDKMLSSREPHISIQQMFDFKITSLSIKPPSEIPEFASQEAIISNYITKSVSICNVLGLLTNTLKFQFQQDQHQDQNLFGLPFQHCSINNKDYAHFQMGLFYSGLLVPFNGLSYTKKKKVVTAIQHILIESLKQSNEIQRTVQANIAGVEVLERLVDQFAERDESTLNDQERLTISKELRSIGGNYAAASLLLISKQYVNVKQSVTHTDIDTDLLQFQIISKHKNLNALIDRENLRNIHKLKAMVDGGAIQVLYNCKAGKHIKGVMDECLEYQIIHPDAQQEEVQAYIVDHKDEFMAKYGAK